MKIAPDAKHILYLCLCSHNQNGTITVSSMSAGQTAVPPTGLSGGGGGIDCPLCAKAFRWSSITLAAKKKEKKAQAKRKWYHLRSQTGFAQSVTANIWNQACTRIADRQFARAEACGVQGRWSPAGTAPGSKTNKVPWNVPQSRSRVAPDPDQRKSL